MCVKNLTIVSVKQNGEMVEITDSNGDVRRLRGQLVEHDKTTVTIVVDSEKVIYGLDGIPVKEK